MFPGWYTLELVERMTELLDRDEIARRIAERRGGPIPAEAVPEHESRVASDVSKAGGEAAASTPFLAPPPPADHSGEASSGRGMAAGEQQANTPQADPAWQPTPPNYLYVRPLKEASQTYIDVVENPRNRFMVGLKEIDVLTRGFGPRELVLVVGYSHGGKTQVALTSIVNNPNARIAYFSLDDPAEMVTVKLLAMTLGIDAEEIEQRIRSHDPEMRKMLLDVQETFPNLLVFDQSFGFKKIENAVEEAQQYWQAPPDAVIIDYLQLIQAEEYDEATHSVQARTQAAKRLIKGWDWPTLLLHQGSRSHCPPGKPVTILSAAYGGEQEATIILGARRKVFAEDATDRERALHANTVTLHVVKNKRPPSKTTPYPGVDFKLTRTGKIVPLDEIDSPQVQRFAEQMGVLDDGEPF